MDSKHLQRDFCRLTSEVGLSILNVGCKEDSAKLGMDYGADNLDINLIDPFTGINLEENVPNFHHGDAANIPFKDGEFNAVVLGDFCDCCTPEFAEEVILECLRILAENGRILITYSQDERLPQEQHSSIHIFNWCQGCTSYHSKVWSDDEFCELLCSCGLVPVEAYDLQYYLGPGFNCPGRGWVIERMAEIKDEDLGVDSLTTPEAEESITEGYATDTLSDKGHNEPVENDSPEEGETTSTKASLVGVAGRLALCMS